MNTDKKNSILIFFCILPCLALLGIPAFAQSMCDVYQFQLDKVKGKVFSDGPKGDEPIPNAKIELRRITNDLKVTVIKTIFSDSEGFYDLGKVKKGKYQLAVNQEELRFSEFVAGIYITKKNDDALKESMLYIRLGVTECGGKVWEVKD